MQTSESIKELSTALVGFHKQMGKISKTSTNPYFKSKYADLPTILAAIAEPLNDNGLVITQFPEGQNELTTRLIHSSGEWMQASYVMPVSKPNDPQALGSSISYQRRYSLMAVLALTISDEDDDGNLASDTASKAATGKPVDNKEDNKPWLNKDSKEFNACATRLQGGTATIATIREHYKVSKEVQGLLEKHIPQNQN